MSNSSPLDLSKYPGVGSSNPDEILVIGDLHANPMKLIYLMIREGKLNGITEDQYNELNTIYEKALELAQVYRKALLLSDGKSSPANTAALQAAKHAFIDHIRQNLGRFTQILQQAGTGNGKLAVRLIGDELCDRGACDVFIKAALNVFAEKQIEFDELLSNHGVEALSKDPNSRRKFDGPKEQGQGLSGLTMDLLESEAPDVIRANGLEHFMAQVYLPRLKLGAYIIQSKDNISLDFHAPIDRDDIRRQAAFLGLPYKDRTPRELAKTIDAINQRVNQYIREDRVDEIIDIHDHKGEDDLIKSLSREHNPINFAMWNRDVANLNRPPKRRFLDYALGWRHGHTSEEYNNENQAHLVCVDSDFGRTGLDGKTIVKEKDNPKTKVFVRAQGDPGPQIAVSNRFSVTPPIPLKNRLRMIVSAYISIPNNDYKASLIQDINNTPPDQLLGMLKERLTAAVTENPTQYQKTNEYQIYRKLYRAALYDRFYRQLQTSRPANQQEYNELKEKFEKDVEVQLDSIVKLAIELEPQNKAASRRNNANLISDALIKIFDHPMQQEALLINLARNGMNPDYSIQSGEQTLKKLEELKGNLSEKLQTYREYVEARHLEDAHHYIQEQLKNPETPDVIKRALESLDSNAHYFLNQVREGKPTYSPSQVAIQKSILAVSILKADFEKNSETHRGLDAVITAMKKRGCETNDVPQGTANQTTVKEMQLAGLKELRNQDRIADRQILGQRLKIKFNNILSALARGDTAKKVFSDKAEAATTQWENFLHLKAQLKTAKASLKNEPSPESNNSLKK